MDITEKNAIKFAYETIARPFELSNEDIEKLKERIP